jgi:hypothetical protein
MRATSGGDRSTGAIGVAWRARRVAGDRSRTPLNTERRRQLATIGPESLRRDGPVKGDPQLNTDNIQLELHGDLGGEAIDLVTRDAAIIQAIGCFETAEGGVLSLLETGARAIVAATAGFDLQTVRQEIERALGEEGPLAAALLRQADGAAPGSFVSRIQDTTKHIDELLADARKAIGDELMRACDRQSEALGRTVRDFRDLDPASGVGGALTRIETMLRDQAVVLAANRAAAAEYERGSAKGLDYEEFVAQVVADIAAVHGDRAERSGADAGLRRGDKRLAKRGDVTVFVEGEPVVVIEAKDTARVSSAAIKRELDEAMENRGAAAAVVVVSTDQGSLMCGQALVHLRSDMWAVHLPKTASDPLPLRIAYFLARQTALAKVDRYGAAELDEIRARAEEITRRLTPLTEIRQHIANSVGSQEKASAALISFERELRSSLFALLDSLRRPAERTAA